jgi:hypothetical protein
LNGRWPSQQLLPAGCCRRSCLRCPLCAHFAEGPTCSATTPSAASCSGVGSRQLQAGRGIPTREDGEGQEQGQAQLQVIISYAALNSATPVIQQQLITSMHGIAAPHHCPQNGEAEHVSRPTQGAAQGCRHLRAPADGSLHCRHGRRQAGPGRQGLPIGCISLLRVGRWVGGEYVNGGEQAGRRIRRVIPQSSKATPAQAGRSWPARAAFLGQPARQPSCQPLSHPPFE